MGCDVGTDMSSAVLVLTTALFCRCIPTLVQPDKRCICTYPAQRCLAPMTKAMSSADTLMATAGARERAQGDVPQAQPGQQAPAHRPRHGRRGGRRGLRHHGRAAGLQVIPRHSPAQLIPYFDPEMEVRTGAEPNKGFRAVCRAAEPPSHSALLASTLDNCTLGGVQHDRSAADARRAPEPHLNPGTT